MKFKGKIKDTQGILKLPFLKILFAFLNQRIDIRIFCRSHHFHYALPMFINLQVPLLFKWNLPLIEAQFYFGEMFESQTLPGMSVPKDSGQWRCTTGILLIT